MNKSKFQIQKNKARKPVFAKKSLGQNFLADENYIDKIVSSLNLQNDETVIEIGPGRGAITEALVENAGKVIAIELDRNLIPYLNVKFNDKENFHLTEADALEIDFSELLSGNEQQTPCKLVANLPYYISTAILQKLIEQRDCFSEMVLMFQSEVVERITAKVGNSERGFLTVMTEAYLETEKLFDVPPRAFQPVPKVWSAVIRLKPKQEAEIQNEKLFRRLVSASFRQKRKTITNNLKSELENIENILDVCQIDKRRRAETLSVEEWKCLVNQAESKL